jgi:hypothetical protein
MGTCESGSFGAVVEFGSSFAFVSMVTLLLSGLRMLTITAASSSFSDGVLCDCWRILTRNDCWNLRYILVLTRGKFTLEVEVVEQATLKWLPLVKVPSECGGVYEFYRRAGGGVGCTMVAKVLATGC